MKEKIHNKLVRDKIGEILKEQGILCDLKTLKKSDYQEALLKKLLEEANEYAEENQIEELADLLEVIHALLKYHEISFEDLESLRREKHLERGGFEKRVFLEKTFERDFCPFCEIVQKKQEIEVLGKFLHCFAIKDKFPVSNGHLLIIPYEHYNQWFETPKKVRKEMWLALDQMKIKLDLEYRPQGYNMGMNCGLAAGQTIMHVHMHLIPRYLGDCLDPKGGIRGVIAEKQKYD